MSPGTTDVCGWRGGWIEASHPARRFGLHPQWRGQLFVLGGGWMVDWVVDWVVGWVVDWVDRKVDGRVVSLVVNWVVGRLVDRIVDWLVGMVKISARL